jgi:Ni,Fe-hydrogenase III large subunit
VEVEVEGGLLDCGVVIELLGFLIAHCRLSFNQFNTVLLTDSSIMSRTESIWWIEDRRYSRVSHCGP